MGHALVVFGGRPWRLTNWEEGDPKEHSDLTNSSSRRIFRCEAPDA